MELVYYNVMYNIIQKVQRITNRLSFDTIFTA
jgi:hypothetical protein